MKHLFKISDIDEQLTVGEVWDLKTLIEIVESKTDLPFSEIFVWTKATVDDKGLKVSELHFGTETKRIN